MKKILIILFLFVFVNTTYAYWEEIQVSGEKPVRAFITVEDYLFASTLNSGVYFSSDNGETWEKRDNGLENIEVTAFATIGNNIYVGTDGNGVYYTTDLGDNWEPKNSGIENVKVYSLASFNNNIVIGSIGAYFSNNGGDSWVNIFNGLTETEPYLFGTVFINTNFIIIGENKFKGGLFISDDYGNNWVSGTLKAYINSVEFFDNSIIVGTTIDTGIFLSSDTGNIWINLNNNLLEKNIFAIKLVEKNIFAGTFNKLYVSNDMGNLWADKSIGLKDTSFIGYFNNNSEYIFAGSLPKKIFHSNDIPYYPGSNLYRAKIEAVTSVDDSKPQRNKLTIFPNPATELIHISTDAIIINTELTDILGRTVFKQSGNVEQISTAGLAPGLYLLKLYTAGGEVLTEKVVVR